MTEVLSMGGYAAYVWPAYAIALAVLGGLTVMSFHRVRALEAEVSALEAAAPRRRRPRGGRG